MLNILKMYTFALNAPKPLWFHFLNVTIKIKTAVMMKTTPRMKMQIILLMRRKKFKKSFFHSDIEDMVQVREIALTKANDPVHFFYLVLYITKEQGSITEIVKDDYGFKCHPGSKIICGKYLEIFKDWQKQYVDQREAAVLYYSVTELCPKLMIVDFYMKKKLISGYSISNTLNQCLKELSSKLLK